VAETMGVGEYRAHYRAEDKRKNLGNGEPFWIEDEAATAPELNFVDENSSQPAERPPAPAATPPPQKPQQKPAEPKAFAPPPVPPTASAEMSNFMFLWQMARQDSAQQMQLMMAQTQLMVQTSEARAQQAIQQSREFYAAMQAQQSASQALLLEAGKVDAPAPELLEALNGQTTALAHLGQRLDGIEQADDQADQMQQLLEAMQNGEAGEKGPNAFGQMLQGMIPMAVRLFENYITQQPGAAGPAGDVVDTVIDPVDSAAE